MVTRSVRTATLALLVAIVLPIAKDANASSLRVLDGKRESLQARVDLIQQAQHSIDLSYYAIDTDEVPIALLELLRQASLRGVRVRILVDGLKSRLPAKFEQYLQRNRVQVRVYHPLHQGNPSWLNRRLHSKLMVVDAQRAVIGSSNLENEHFELKPGRGFVDCDAIVAGPIAQQTQAYFDWLWATPDVRPAPPRDSLGLDVLRSRPFGRSDWKNAWRDAKTDRDYQRLLDRALQHVVCQGGVHLDPQRDWIAEASHGIQMRLLHDRSSDKSEHHVNRQIVRMIDRARSSVLIESPYPAFDRSIRSAISRARARGVCVTILTNSLDTTDQLNVYAAYQNHKRGLLREGVQLREYAGRDTLHSKTLLVDDSSWMLGSYNFDARSNLWNLELCLVSDDPAGAAQLWSNLQPRLVNSTPIRSGTLILPVGQDAAISKRSRLMIKRSVIELYRGLL
ncbi:Major cardiolipin synthase ClsA [Stieleria maiorica]|uniref:Major cardiolipin synthase ClsA n=1 Tax=Stieleria maiorica TaxID=2795974 RepID=A0A5B9MGU4_9BACT|nr:phosphatidylserine/phosphatidylglycerophosphate/cardiolipin synthase family protein [Stieleria maiorica]QEF98297.1 Major cardiolipin synthase ClsA [Stieleria maiorica]